MYDKMVTMEQLRKEQERLAKSDRGFELRERTVSEIQAFCEQLDALVKPDRTGLVRQLSKQEQRFVRGERVLCRWDFRYWMERYHNIRRWDETYGRMTPNLAQEAFIGVLAEHERKGIAFMAQLLKARQLGVTTGSESVVQHRVQFHPNVWATVASADPEKSKLMMNMILDSYEMHPWWLRPERTSYSAGDYMEFRGIRSLISIQHGAKKKSDIGRGGTPTVSHLSECATFLNPADSIDSALVFAIHPTPTTYLVLESTAETVGDWWHNTWENSKAHWNDPYSPSLLRPIFFPWYVGRDIYPTNAWLAAHPIPTDWQPATLTIQHAERAREYVRQTFLLWDVLGMGWEMPREQMWWWEVTREDYKRRKDENGGSLLGKFLRECCSSDVEAFQSQYSTVFDAETIELYSNSLREPLGAYVLDGPEDEIRWELKPERRELDVSKPPIPIDGGRYVWRPVTLEGYPTNFGFDNKLLVWERGENEQVYGLGVDTAKGVGQDSGVVEVLRKATREKVPRQVAEWASNRVSSADMHPWVHSLARLYCVKQDGSIKQPKLAIDTGNGGDATQNALRKMGWSYFHVHTRPDKKVIDEGKAGMIGFVMSEWVRDMVVGATIKALRDFLVDIESPELLKELRCLERNVEKNRFDHPSGGHDDRFMGLGMILTSFYMYDWSGLFSLFGKSRMALTQSLGEVKEEEWMAQPLPSPQKEMEAQKEAKTMVGEEWLAQPLMQPHNTVPLMGERRP